MILGKVKMQFKPLPPRKVDRMGIMELDRGEADSEFLGGGWPWAGGLAVGISEAPWPVRIIASRCGRPEVFRPLPFVEFSLLVGHHSKDQNKIYLPENAFLCLVNEFSLTLLELPQPVLLSIYPAFPCTVLAAGEQAQPLSSWWILSSWCNTNYMSLQFSCRLAVRVDSFPFMFHIVLIRMRA